MTDPGGIANWSITHVDWSERKWHPKSYGAQDVTYELLQNITVWFPTPSNSCTHWWHLTKTDILAICVGCFCLQSIDVSVHVTSDERVWSFPNILNLYVYLNYYEVFDDDEYWNILYFWACAEGSAKMAMFVEWCTEAMLLICKKVLSWGSK